MPLFNSSVVYPWISSWHLDSCERRKSNLLRAFPEGLERLPPPPGPNVFIRTSVPGSNSGLLDSEAESGVPSWNSWGERLWFYFYFYFFSLCSFYWPSLCFSTFCLFVFYLLTIHISRKSRANREPIYPYAARFYSWCLRLFQWSVQ